jgi:hypothetical protein
VVCKGPPRPTDGAAALSTDDQSLNGRRIGRTVERPPLLTTMLAEEGKMSWADASYFSLQFSSNLNDFDKIPLSASALATALDHVKLSS